MTTTRYNPRLSASSFADDLCSAYQRYDHAKEQYLVEEEKKIAKSLQELKKTFLESLVSNTKFTADYFSIDLRYEKYHQEAINRFMNELTHLNLSPQTIQNFDKYDRKVITEIRINVAKIDEFVKSRQPATTNNPASFFDADGNAHSHTKMATLKRM